MVPDMENGLTGKISTLEQQPVLWNKDQVWSKISAKIATGSGHSRHYYYAAAVLTFILVFNAYRLQEDNPNVLNSISEDKPERINSTDLTVIENVQTLTATDAVLMRPGVSQPVQQSHPEPPVAEPQYIETESEIAWHEENADPLSGVVVARQAKIEPIIGVYEVTPEREAIAKTKGKKLFHKLDQPVKIDDDAYRNAIIIARIK
jgi:hypothetical protein